MIPAQEEIGAFAGTEVLSTLARRYSQREFWRELWSSMGEMGLFGISVPVEYGGRGGTPADIALALRRFAYDSCDLGLTLSWITHLALCIKSIEKFGTAAQREKYLPGLISGEWVGAAAVSEPRTGAHPAGIQTTATRTPGGYRLDGSKMYITDGTVADLLVVVAATGESAGRKELTAFLVETALAGVTAERMDLNFLQTSPHANLSFKGVELPEDAVLGAVGEGHSQASKSAFARERSLVLSAFVGLFRSAADACACRITAEDGKFELEGNETASFIHHMAALAAYEELSTSLTVSAFVDPERFRASMDVLVYLGISYAKWAAWIEDFTNRHELARSFPLDIMLNDTKLILVGEGMIYKEGRRRFVDIFNETSRREGQD